MLSTTGQAVGSRCSSVARVLWRSLWPRSVALRYVLDLGRFWACVVGRAEYETASSAVGSATGMTSGARMSPGSGLSSGPAVGTSLSVGRLGRRCLVLGDLLQFTGALGAGLLELLAEADVRVGLGRGACRPLFRRVAAADGVREAALFLVEVNLGAPVDADLLAVGWGQYAETDGEAVLLLGERSAHKEH